MFDLPLEPPKSKMLINLKLFFRKFISRNLYALTDLCLPETDGTWVQEGYAIHTNASPGPKNGALQSISIGYKSKKIRQDELIVHNSLGPTHVYVNVHADDNFIQNMFYVWMSEGLVHRLDGPAHIRLNFDSWFSKKPLLEKTYYVNGLYCAKNEYAHEVIRHVLQIDDGAIELIKKQF